MTLAPATKVLSPQTPEEINLLPLSLCLSAGLNRGHGPGRSSRVLHNVALMGCEDKQMAEMRHGSHGDEMQIYTGHFWMMGDYELQINAVTSEWKKRNSECPKKLQKFNFLSPGMCDYCQLYPQHFT